MTSGDDDMVDLLTKTLRVLALQVSSGTSVTEGARALKFAGLDNQMIADVLNTSPATIRALTANLRATVFGTGFSPTSFVKPCARSTTRREAKRGFRDNQPTIGFALRASYHQARCNAPERSSAKAAVVARQIGGPAGQALALDPPTAVPPA